MILLTPISNLQNDLSPRRKIPVIPVWGLAPLCALLFYLYAARYPEPPFLSGDAAQYWQLGESFISGGHFSFQDGEQTFRGYLFPAFLGLLQLFGKLTEVNPFQLFYAINAIITAVALIVAAPSAAASMFSVRITTYRVALFVALFFFFWRGYLVEPLTDTLSLFLIITSATLLLHVPGRSKARVAIFVLLSGCSLAAAVNLRPIYLVCIPLYFTALLLFCTSWQLRFIGVLMGTVGAMIVLLPQSFINQRFLGSWNPFIHSGSLYVQQIFFGLVIQRHECAFFADPSGIELLHRTGISFFTPAPNGELLFAQDMSQLSIDRYIRIAMARPLDVAAIYTRHIVNGLALLGSNIYACSLQQPRWLFNLAAIAVVVSAATIAFVRAPKLASRRHHLLVWAPLVTVFLTVPTAMEGRFFFPIHLFAYAYLSFLTPWRDLVLSRRRVITFATVLFAILALTTAVLSGTYASALAPLGADARGLRLKPLPALFEP